MSAIAAPRIEVRLDSIEHNARTLVRRLAEHGVEVAAVTKAVLGSPQVARRLLAAGVSGLADSRLDNVAVLRRAGLDAEVTLVRSPMRSQVDAVVACCDTSCNSEPIVIRSLSAAAGAQHRTHRVVLMVELGDLREGILAEDLLPIARLTDQLPHVTLHGIGANLACRSGVVPDDENMARLSALAGSVEDALGTRLAVVSGGNSANLSWIFDGGAVGRVNQLRLGEAILLGCDPLDRTPIGGLRTDAFRVVAEVIESKRKPSAPWGSSAQGAFGPVPQRSDRGVVCQSILAIGRQDVEPSDLTAFDVQVTGSSSDHLVVESDGLIRVGAEVTFRPGYAAVLQAMTSPFVQTHYLSSGDGARVRRPQ